jgi:hypothetical protein
VDAVDERLSALGRSTKEAIYGFLQSDYGMEMDEIADRLSEFSRILIETVGPSSARILDFIIERFYSCLHLVVPPARSLREAIDLVQLILRKQPTLQTQVGLTVQT